jgi:hypothetical protein
MSSAVLVQTNGSGCRLLAAVRTTISIVFRHHPKNNVIELVVSVTGSDVVRNPGIVSSTTNIGVPAVWRIGSTV